MLSRLIFGARFSLFIGVVVVGIAADRRHRDRRDRGLFPRLGRHDDHAGDGRHPRLPVAAAGAGAGRDPGPDADERDDRHRHRAAAAFRAADPRRVLSERTRDYVVSARSPVRATRG
jgi:hypothetical protein